MKKNIVSNYIHSLIFIVSVVFFVSSCRESSKSGKVDFDKNGVVVFYDDSQHYVLAYYGGKKGEAYDGWSFSEDLIMIPQGGDHLKLKKSDYTLVVVSNTREDRIKIDEEQYVLLSNLTKPYPTNSNELLAKINAEQVVAPDGE